MKYVIDVSKDKLKALNALGIETEDLDAYPTVVIPDYDWPRKGDTFYYINAWGEVKEDTWKDHSGLQENQKAFGNVFRTKEDAEFVIQKLMMLKNFNMI